jgi:hypothetical protein
MTAKCAKDIVRYPPAGLGAARAQVSEANSTNRDKGFVRLKRLLGAFFYSISIG